MKKVFSTFLFFLVVCIAHSQTTYYWVGGASTTSYTSNGNWNTSLDGTGALRSVAGAQITDILIFDGTNIGGTTPTTGNVNATVSSQTCGKLIVQNGAIVNLTRSSTGSAVITINGDTGDDFVIDASSTLTVGGPLYNYDISVVLGSSATGLINGTLYLSPLSTSVHTRSFITSSAAGSLVFATGSSCHITDSTTTSGFNSSVSGGVIFKTGASLYYYSGRSPIGTNSTTQTTNFEPGSNLYFRGSNVFYTDGTTAYGSSGWVNNKILSNVFIQNNSTITGDGQIYKMDDLTIDAGCKLTVHTSGSTPVLGNLVVNGTLAQPVAASTNALVMGGNSPQIISGSGNIKLSGFIVANHSDVTLSKSITIDTACIVLGKLNFGTSNKISGTSTFTSRVISSAPTASGNTTTGSFQITSATPVSGNVGLYITGPGIPANTNVIASSSSGQVLMLSKAATSTSTGSIFNFSSDSATLVTSNPNGMDTLTGSVIVTGVKSFQSGTNYIINAATVKPIGISTTATTSMTLGNLTLNAPATTNFNTRITGTVTLNSGKLNIRSSDTLIITSGNNIGGAPFNSAKYIVTEKSGALVGSLRMNGFSTAKLFPIGSINNYLPVTLTPTTVDTFSVNVFEGATTDGTPNGTAMDVTQKARIVDAIWNINRISVNTDACGITTNWTSSLDGSLFINYANNEIGISRYTGTAWTPAAGTGDNIANTATNNTFTSFGAFGIGKVGITLPVKISNLNATQEQGKIKLTWNVSSEINVSNYTLEKSNDGIHFNTLLTVNANNNQSYNCYDFTPSPINYYRIKVLDHNNSFSYSGIVKIKTSSTKAELVVYPNPVVNNQFSIQLSNIAKGKTDVVIYNNIGQQVFSKSIVSEEGSQTQFISLPTSISKGLYKLVITNNETKLQQTLLMQ